MILAWLAVGGVALAVLAIGTRGGRRARTTSDLLVASRSVAPWWNGAAIAGEYISASSFLGIAGLTMKIGVVALWQPVGFGLGYLALLLFVAAPLRRSGSYTIGDLAESRLRSPRLRLLTSAVVVLICAFYITPQLKGAGLTIGAVTGAPYWVGVMIVAALVALLVGLGGMRGITAVQAFQFFVKLFAISVPAIALLIYLGGPPNRATLFGKGLPRAPARGVTVQIDQPQRVVFPVAASYEVSGIDYHAVAGQHVTLPPGRFTMAAGSIVPIAAGIQARDGRQWSRPVSTGGSPNALLVYSLLFGTCLGTMGLPHILVRFYTNPDGKAARRTNLWVLVMLGIFYVTPLIYSVLGRALTPGLYVTGNTDSVVLDVPRAAWPGIGGQLLSAVVDAGAFAAFTAAASGLLVSMAGTLTYDVWPRMPLLARRAPADRRKRFRMVAALAMALPAVVALFVRQDDISVLVGAALGLAASTFCPLLLLGIWWSRLTAHAAAAGMLAGAGTATTAIVLGLVLNLGTGNALGALLAQPAVVTVPIAFAVMIVMSLLERPDSAGEASMLALHRPEAVAPLVTSA